MKQYLQRIVLAFIIFTNAHSEKFFITGELSDLVPLSQYDVPNIGKVTVITQPINENASQAVQGHIGVTSSVLRGFEKLKYPMNYNPRTIDEVGDHLMVLVDINALYQAIELKRQGRIKTLIVGPNILGNPNQYDHILASPEIDWYIAPCNWARTSNCEEEPGIIGKTAIWYAGVDTDRWKPIMPRIEAKTILIYWKTEPESFCQAVENKLHEYGWETICIQYGSYSQEQYKHILNQVDAAVFISVSESQGIALAECWSMDVPTLVWNPGTAWIYNRWIPVCSAPYLTPKTGFFWTAIEDLEKLLSNF